MPDLWGGAVGSQRPTMRAADEVGGGSFASYPGQMAYSGGSEMGLLPPGMVFGIEQQQQHEQQLATQFAELAMEGGTKAAAAAGPMAAPEREVLALAAAAATAAGATGGGRRGRPFQWRWGLFRGRRRRLRSRWRRRSRCRWLRSKPIRRWRRELGQRWWRLRRRRDR